MRVIAGTAFGQRAPAPTFSPTLYVAVEMDAGAALDIRPSTSSARSTRSTATLSVDGAALPERHMAVLEPDRFARVEAASAARCMLLGGASMDGDRVIWWNFVASSRELIDAASERWRDQAFDAVPGETEFIPLPER